MIDWNRWLPGLGQDESEEEESAVTKTLRALGLGPPAPPVPTQPTLAAPFQDTYEPTPPPLDPDLGPHEQPYPGTVVPIINPDGSRTTERSITVTEPELNAGRATNIPSVWSGAVVPDDEAIQNAVYSRRDFPSYDTIDDAVSAAVQRSRDLGAGGTSIGGATPFAAPPEQRPPQYSGPSYAPRPLEPGEQSTAERLPTMAQAGIEGAGAMLGDRGAMLAGLKPPQSAMDVIEQAAPAPVRGLQIGREALRAAGGAALEAAPQTTDPLFTTNEIQTPLGTIPSMTGPTPQQAGRFVGEELADPTNYLSFGAAGRAADAPVGAALSAAGRGLRAAPGAVRRGVGAAAGAVGDALEGNAERMAAADARMAAEGSTTAPGVFGALPEPSRQRQTVEALQDQLETATAAWQRARDAGDERMAALAREHAVALESELVDARNARLELEPRIRSDVGRQIEDLPLDEDIADTLSGAGARRGATSPEDLSGPVGIPVDLSGRANASAGALPATPGLGALPAVNRVLSEGIAGGVGGAVIEQGRNPDEDPRTAAARGFVAGAVGFPLATRGARGLARLAGARGVEEAGGALATVGGLPGDGGAARRARLAAQRAAANPGQIANLAGQAASVPMTGPHTNGQHVTRNVAKQIQKQSAAGIPPQVPTGPMPPPDPPPNWWDHVENWRYNLGLFAQLSTGMVQAAGGVIQAAGGGAAEALRLGVLKGQPEALLPIAGEALRALPGGIKSAAATAAGRVPKAIEAGSDYKPSLHAREFAQGNVGRGVAALAVGTPGRIMTQAPDALWYEMFHKAGIAQAAADEARRQAGGSPLAMADRLRIQRDLITNPTPEILEEATKLAQNATYKGEPGRAFGTPKKITEALGPVGSFFMPIYNTIARIHEQALEYTPGVGMLPLEKVGLAPKNQARPVSRRIAQQAVGGSLVLGGLSYAAEGGIRGPGPSNSNEAQAMRDQGYTPNTTNVGGYWIPNTWFGPWGPILNEIGAINDARLYDHGDKGWDDLTWEKKAAAIITMSGRAAADYPALEAAQTITKLFTAPEDALPSFLGEVAAQYVPGPLRTKGMAEDTKARTRTRGPDVPFEQRLWETVKQRSGVGREQLPIAQDILGRDVENPRQGWGKALAPNIREEKPDPIIQAFLDADLNIGDPPTALSVGALKPGLEPPALTPEETRRWNTIRGDQVITSVGTLLASDAWATHDAAWRKSALESRRAAAGEYAHGTLRKEIGETEVRRRMSERGTRKAAS